jgi:hypothetical protein
MKLGETRSFWSLQGLSNAVENGGHLGSTADERLASLNLENVSTREGVTNSANERAILHRGELIDGDEFALLGR